MTTTELVEQVLRTAGAALLRMRDHDDYTVSHKPGGDAVTTADHRSEAIIVDTLQQHFPRDSILSEECGLLPGDPSRVWLVDPLDGTGNYIRGLRPWGVTVALVRGGEVVVGGFHDPQDDTMLLTELGGGTWLDGTRLALGEQHRAGRLVIGLNASSPPWRPEAQRILEAVWNTGAEIRMIGCGAAALSSVAVSSLAAFVEIDGGPWDYAAGALAVCEAGGYATTLTGSKIDDNSHTVLAAIDGELHGELMRLVGRRRQSRKMLFSL